MKPCSCNRKLIAWLALGELDASHEADLRAHIQCCDECRRYLHELSSVTETLTTGELTRDIEASQSFHRRVVAGLRAERSRWSWTDLAVQLGAARLGWRAALSLLGTTALVVALLSVLWRQPGLPGPAPARVLAVLPPGPRNHLTPTISNYQKASITHHASRIIMNDLSPTISNYQRVANRSLDELDDLLTRQDSRRSSPTRFYTASMFAAANVGD